MANIDFFEKTPRVKNFKSMDKRALLNEGRGVLKSSVPKRRIKKNCAPLIIGLRKFYKIGNNP